MIASSGCLVQALTPASASEADISLRKPRRPTGSSHSDAFCGNSRCRNSLNSGVPESSSRLRQYSLPRAPSSWARSAWMSLGSLMSASPVARRATRVALDRVLLHEPRSENRLRLGRRIAHREDLRARTNVVFRVAVTVEAPLHLQRVLLEHERHLVDAPVARLAAHALL